MAPIYEYKAYNTQGNLTKGIVESDSVKTARQKLKKSGLMVTEIGEKGSSGVPAAGGAAGSSSSAFSFLQGASPKDISLITRQLASLVKANIPLVEALSAMVEQTEKQALKIVLDQVRQSVNEGLSLSKSMAKHPKVFDTIFVNMVDAGESSGNLSLVLLRLAELKESQVRLKSKVQSAMTYPALMMVVSLGLMLVIFTFVIPKLAQIFTSMNKPMPLLTRVLIQISSILVNYWYIIFPALAVAFVMFLQYIGSKAGKPVWHAFILKAPIFGSLVRLVAVTRFARTMGTLLGSGVPILMAMNIAKNLVGNVWIEKAVTDARENITEGQSIAGPLKKSGQFPPLVIHMIAIGEKTGELPNMLKMVADTYEEQVNTRIEGLTSLLEPLMIVVMGGITAVIVLAIFVPLMDLSNITR